MVKKHVLISFLAMIIALVFCLRSVFPAFGSVDTSIELREAEAMVKEAFIAVSSAERTGANISALVVMLNEAQYFLSQANASFLSGDEENLSLMAQRCIVLANETMQNARDLQSQTEKAVGDELIWASSLSAIGLIALLVIGMLGWKRVKSVYLKRVLEMKPERVNDA